MNTQEEQELKNRLLRVERVLEELQREMRDMQRIEALRAEYEAEYDEYEVDTNLNTEHPRPTGYGGA